MKFLVLLILAVCSLNAKSYYSKLEPIESYEVRAYVGGKVENVNKQFEGKIVEKNIIVEIESKLDKLNLREYKNKLNSLKTMLNIENTNYEKIKKVRTKSDFEKDTQRIKALNYQSQIADLKITIENLQDQIEKKIYAVENKYISNIEVNENDYITPGTLLFSAKDLTKGKLEIYLPIDEAKDLIQKEIYLDNVKSDVYSTKLYKVADEKHISSYKFEIVINSPKSFSNLVKIDFK